MTGIRVCAVQYKLEDIDSFDQFAFQVRHYVRNASEYEVQVILFPEFFTTQLLSIGDAAGAALTIDRLPSFTDAYVELFQALAAEYDVHIIGGTHVIALEDGKLNNAAHLFYPDGRVEKQPKLHMTPTEREEWNMSPGDGLEVFDTPFGTIAMLTCYDIEFPEIVRMARAKGADIIFCPSCTDDRHGFYRVRYCCHARAVENQVYIVTTGTVGSLRKVDFMRANYGQAAVISPNDIPFPPAGIMTEGVINDDMLVVADLDVRLLHDVRAAGSVTTWRDRRIDLYGDWS
ncbi:carbon-nitrogen hydrolase family protein [Paenibacillus sacheonensis]|uniref:Acyltransferase n=1 Tax=Paenibacillus sacheonensis TaxID=742054 RepID=A0A7X4YKJ8_9BACL|nr:carbon-nitrogen hydrolase family protein [Paenibacillus sacheonensis]MBM7563355.1 putative amidohydrolase [Paenibacillus sacheonensis]NBC68090.1 acyltransferase [Paenibacillus sacheonensis]